MTDADPNAAFEHAVAQRIRERDLQIAAWLMRHATDHSGLPAEAALYEQGWNNAVRSAARSLRGGLVP